MMVRRFFRRALWAWERSASTRLGLSIFLGLCRCSGCLRRGDWATYRLDGDAPAGDKMIPVESMLCRKHAESSARTLSDPPLVVVFAFPQFVPRKT